MKQLKKIMVAVDWDESSRQGLLTAAWWAGKFGVELHLVHVVPNVKIIPEVMGDSSWINAQYDEAELAMTGWEQMSLAGGARTISSEIRQGVVHEEILLAATAVDAGVIVCGTGDHHRTPHPRLGGTAERLVRYADKPVLVQCADCQLTPKTILCPVDMSETSARALRNSIFLAPVCDAELIVLFVNQHSPMVIEMPGHLAQGIREDWDRLQEHDFARFLSGFDFQGVRFRAMIRSGRPEEQIMAAIAEYHVDLTIMGSVGRTGITRLLLGSVTQKVAHAMPCSIMTVKQKNVPALEILEEAREIDKHYRIGQERQPAGAAEEAKRESTPSPPGDRLFAPDLGGAGGQSREARIRADMILNTIWSREAAAESRRRHGRPGPK